MINEQTIEAHVTRNPGILEGKPIIRGTRIAVELIADWVAAETPIEQIVDDYPNLTREDIEAALAFRQQEQARTDVRAW